MSAQTQSATERYTGTERLLAFSDGVFAIAITLLVLSIGVPQVAHGLLDKVVQQWPQYLAYVLSFFVIGIIWAQHTRCSPRSHAPITSSS